MRANIHPDYKIINVTCSCGNTFQTRSSLRSEVMRAEVCNKCHPFCTGQYRTVDTGGRIQRFMERYGTYKKGNAAVE